MMDLASSSKKLAHDTGDQDIVAYSLVATSAQKSANVEERKPLRLAIVTVYRSSDFRTEPADQWLQYPSGTILVQTHPTMTREEIDRLRLAIEQSGYTNIILISGGGEEVQQQQPIEEAGYRNISPMSWLIPLGVVSGIVVVIGAVSYVAASVSKSCFKKLFRKQGPTTTRKRPTTNKLSFSIGISIRP